MSNRNQFGADDDTHEGVVNLLLHFERHYPEALPDPERAINAALEITGPREPMEAPKAKGLDPEKVRVLAENRDGADATMSLFSQLNYAGQS